MLNRYLVVYPQNEYPQDVDWQSVKKRIIDMRDIVQKIIESEEPSHSELLDVAAKKKYGSRQSRTPLISFERRPELLPGYYGGKGSELIQDVILSMFDKEYLRRHCRGRPLNSFITDILIPEVAVRLISEDHQTDLDDARTIMSKSVNFGLRFHTNDNDEISSEGSSSLSSADENDIVIARFDKGKQVDLTVNTMENSDTSNRLGSFALTDMDMARLRGEYDNGLLNDKVCSKFLWFGLIRR